MDKPDCVLLDLGKVLVDFDFRNFADRMLALSKLEPEQLRSAIMGNGLASKYETGQIDDACFHAEICRRLQIQITFADFADAWNSIFLPTPVLPDKLLADLSARAPLWILSNTNRLHFDFICERYSFLRHFKGYIVSHEVGSAKPEPHIFHHALDKAGIRASQTLFVDDTLPNVLAAQEMGIEAFQFIGVGHFEEELIARELL